MLQRKHTLRTKAKRILTYTSHENEEIKYIHFAQRRRKIQTLRMKEKKTQTYTSHEGEYTKSNYDVTSEASSSDNAVQVRNDFTDHVI